MVKRLDPFRKTKKRGSSRRLTSGGEVFTDRDYSSVFRRKSVKNIVIALCLLPILAVFVVFWLMGYELFVVCALIFLLLSIALISFIVKVSA